MTSAVRQILNWSMRVALAATFIAAGLVKAIDPGEFARAIENYRLLPSALVAPAALYLPWLEILCGAALLYRPLERGANVLLLVLILVFSVALAAAWARGLDIACGCFGDRRPGEYGLSLVRNFAIAAGLAIVSFMPLGGRIQRA